MPKIKTNKAKVEPLMLRAQFEPSTYSEESRTVDVTFATDTPVRRYDWLNDRYFDEVLTFGPGQMRTDRLDAGAPFLDNHSSWGGVRNTLGVVEGFSIEGNSARATVRFSKREEVDGVLQDVRDGILRNISVGYRVHKYEKEMREDGGTPVYRATDWEPYEISLVSIPADPKSGVRSADSTDFNEVELTGEEPTSQNRSQQTNKSELIMKREQIIAMLAKRGISVDANITDEALNAELERALNPEGADPKAVQTAIENERKRSADITTAVRSAKLPGDLAEKLIADGKSIDEARAAIIEEFAKQDPNAGVRSQNVSVGEDKDLTMRRSAAEAALVMRENPELVRGDKSAFKEEVVKQAQQFRGMTLLDMAKDSLVRGGVDVNGMDKMQIVGRAFTSSSSDFPVLLEGANRTVLLASYEAQADTWRRFCATGSVSDFREHKRLRMGSFSDLDSMTENGEFKNKKITDADFEKVSVGTKGNIINVSRKMIINDDLGGFLKLAGMFGRSAARSIENDVYALLALNAGLGPVMADGKTLFHASHGNIATAAAPTVAVLDAMRQLMAKQKDKDGNDFLDIRPALALAPLSLGSTLRVLNNSQYDNDADKFQKPNVVAGLFQDVIDTPRLTGTPFYMFANPSDEPVIEVNFLNGEQSPYMESEQGFTVDGMQWKIRLDYGIGAVGYRGVVRNAGA